MVEAKRHGRIERYGANRLVRRQSCEPQKITKHIRKKEAAAGESVAIGATHSIFLIKSPAIIPDVLTVRAARLWHAVGDNAHAFCAPAPHHQLHKQRMHVRPIADQVDPTDSLVYQGNLLECGLLHAGVANEPRVVVKHVTKHAGARIDAGQNFVGRCR